MSIDQPALPALPAPPPPSRSPGLEALFGLIVAGAVVVLGAPVGLIWAWVAPKVELVQTAYGIYPIDGEPEGYFADDGWFMIVGAVAGIVLAVAAWLLLRRHRGPLVLLGLVIGSAGASVLAAWLGNKIGAAHYQDLIAHAPVDTHIFRPPKVRAGEGGLLFGIIPWVRGSMLVQALVAAAVYTGLAGFHASPTLTHAPDPTDNPAGDYAYQPAYAQLAYGQPAMGESGFGQFAAGEGSLSEPGDGFGQSGVGGDGFGQSGVGGDGFGQAAPGAPTYGQAAHDYPASGHAADGGPSHSGVPTSGGDGQPRPGSPGSEPSPESGPGREDWRTP